MYDEYEIPIYSMAGSEPDMVDRLESLASMYDTRAKTGVGRIDAPEFELEIHPAVRELNIPTPIEQRLQNLGRPSISRALLDFAPSGLSPSVGVDENGGDEDGKPTVSFFVRRCLPHKRPLLNSYHAPSLLLCCS